MEWQDAPGQLQGKGYTPWPQTPVTTLLITPSSPPHSLCNEGLGCSEDEPRRMNTLSRMQAALSPGFPGKYTRAIAREHRSLSLVAAHHARMHLTRHNVLHGPLDACRAHGDLQRHEACQARIPCHRIGPLLLRR